MLPLHTRRLAAEGRGAQTVFRDKVTGKIVSQDEFVAARARTGKGGKPIKTKEEVRNVVLYLI